MYNSSEIKRFSISGPILITPKANGDYRGLFSETYRANMFSKIIGRDVKFLQDNLSITAQAGTVRGLHAQTPPYAVGKLIQCVRGSIIDIVVDARGDSPTFGENVRVELSSENRSQLWVPEGFLHGYATQCADTCVMYKQTGYYAPENEISVKWNDSALALDWGITMDDVILSAKDEQAQGFSTLNSLFIVT